MSMKNFRASDMPGKGKSEAPKTSEPEAEKKAPAKKTPAKKAPAKTEANTPKNDPAAVESHTTAVTEEK